MQKTLAAINRAFEEMVCTMQPQEITVKELTERAKINRKTFYLHYTCIEHVYEEAIRRLADGYIEIMGNTEIDNGSGVFNMFSDAIGMVFVIVAALLLCCGALVFASTETITSKQSGAWRSLKPQLKITPRVKKLLPAAACAFAGTWAVGGFYQSYSAAIGIQELGVQSTFVASLTFVSFIAPVALGAALSRGRDKFLLQRFSMLAFFIAVAGVVYAIYSHSLSLFLAFNVMAGIADGAAFTVSMAGIVEGTSLQERAGVLSLIYVVAYGGAALPNLLVSRIAQYFSLLELTAGYAVFTGVMFILVLLTAKRSYYYEA